MTSAPDIRPPSEMAGTDENLRELGRLLEPWKCCGAPSLCGAVCADTELSEALARAHAVIAAAIRGVPHD